MNSKRTAWGGGFVPADKTVRLQSRFRERPGSRAAEDDTDKFDLGQGDRRAPPTWFSRSFKDKSEKQYRDTASPTSSGGSFLPQLAAKSNPKSKEGAKRALSFAPLEALTSWEQLVRRTNMKGLAAMSGGDLETGMCLHVC